MTLENIKGIIIIGFNTTGIPNITGSSILNKDGINDTNPKVLYCLFLSINASIFLITTFTHF